VNWAFDLVLLALLVAAAVVALRVRQLVATVAVLSIYSLLSALLFANMGAVDVAYVEAVLGSALSGVLMLVAVLITDNVRTSRSRRAQWFAIPVVGALVVLLMVGTSGLPDRGDPNAPATVGVGADYIERTLADTDTPNPITSILADYRGTDTMGETAVVFTAALAVGLVLRRGLRTGATP
jgi:multicomponent Na+:H+ antiporter subunit B